MLTSKKEVKLEQRFSSAWTEIQFWAKFEIWSTLELCWIERKKKSTFEWLKKKKKKKKYQLKRLWLEKPISVFIYPPPQKKYPPPPRRFLSEKNLSQFFDTKRLSWKFRLEESETKKVLGFSKKWFDVIFVQIQMLSVFCLRLEQMSFWPYSMWLHL